MIGEPRKLSLGSCTKVSCPVCDFGYILRYFVKPIMQCLTNDIPQYYMRLLTTKCLNQAVLMSYFMLGKKGIAIADYCDTNKVQARHKEGKVANHNLLKSLQNSILHKKCKYRQLYYILITDAEFSHKDGKTRHFPGHVFIIEKIPHNGYLPRYYFHQSYINKYDYDGHIKRNNNSLELTWKDISNMMEKIHYVIQNPEWTKHTVDYWNEITFVNTKHMLGAESGGKMFLCWRKAKIRDCVERLEKYTHQKLKEIHKLKISDMNNIYGDSSAYDSDQKPLKVHEMKSSLENLKNMIAKYKTSSLVKEF